MITEQEVSPCQIFFFRSLGGLALMSTALIRNHVFRLMSITLFILPGFWAWCLLLLLGRLETGDNWGL